MFSNFIFETTKRQKRLCIFTFSNAENKKANKKERELYERKKYYLIKFGKVPLARKVKLYKIVKKIVIFDHLMVLCILKRKGS